MVDPKTSAPRVHQYSVDVQRELGGGVALEVGYVGSHTSDLTLGIGTGGVNIDALNPSYLSHGSDCPQRVGPEPLRKLGLYQLHRRHVVRPHDTGLPSPAALRSLHFSKRNIRYAYGQRRGNADYANYNSLVIHATKRFSHGLVFLSNFTWSKNMDASFAGVGSNLNGQPATQPQNPYTFAGEYSYSTVDAPFRWATSISYNLPFGKGQPFAGNVNRATDYIIGGWVINTVSVFQSGFPLQIIQNNANSAYGYGAQRPNMTSTSPVTSGSLEQRLYNYINPAAFTLAPAATFGNTPRSLGNLRGPTEANWDISDLQELPLWRTGEGAVPG